MPTLQWGPNILCYAFDTRAENDLLTGQEALGGIDKTIQPYVKIDHVDSKKSLFIVQSIHIFLSLICNF